MTARVTLRLPEDLHGRLREVARLCGQSMNSIAVRAVSERVHLLEWNMLPDRERDSRQALENILSPDGCAWCGCPIGDDFLTLVSTSGPSHRFCDSTCTGCWARGM